MEFFGFLTLLFFVLFAYETSNRLKRIQDSVTELRQEITHNHTKATTKEK